MITFRGVPKFDQKGALVLIDEIQLKSKAYNFAQAKLLRLIDELYVNKQFMADAGEYYPLAFEGQTVLLAGLGKPEAINLTSLRIYIKNGLNSPYLKSHASIEIVLQENNEKIINSAIEAVKIGCYQFNKYKTMPADKNVILDRKIIIACGQNKNFEEAEVICDGVNRTRNLVNENADIVNSDYIEKEINNIIKGQKKVSLEILNKKEMVQKKLGLHLAVNKGSPNEPKLIIVKYTGGKEKEGYTALIGKGVTFDTGGLNLKPTGSIEAMRFDMGGAAAVIGTLENIIRLNVKKNILFTCAVAENVTGSKSYKPGDILTSYSGKTVEVANTDAEGRLVLADALSYVAHNYKPKVMIDIATLTGACIVALGLDYTGLVSNDDDLAGKLLKSGDSTDDRLWRLPIYDELKYALKSQFADLRNMGTPKGAGGTITAAEFLRQFTQGIAWAHLDIAGTVFVEAGERLYFGHGATGSGVRLLTHYLMNN